VRLCRGASRVRSAMASPAGWRETPIDSQPSKPGHLPRSVVIEPLYALAARRMHSTAGTHRAAALSSGNMGSTGCSARLASPVLSPGVSGNMGVAEVVPSWKGASHLRGDTRIELRGGALVAYGIFPNVKVTPPAPGIRFERDVPVPLRDGTTLRANVFRPEDAGRFLRLLSAHPYGKDEFPQRTPLGYLPPAGYRFIRTLEPISHSPYTPWEGPDPSYWVPRGYAVINLDLRGLARQTGPFASAKRPRWRVGGPDRCRSDERRGSGSERNQYARKSDHVTR
jgi:hypothetical protein